MKFCRRKFLHLAAGAAALPVAAHAQQSPKMRRIGFLGASLAAGYASRLDAFRSGLRELGYVEDANIAIEYRWAEDKYELLPTLAAELVRANVDLIVTHGTPASLALKQATSSIPIVIAVIGDPVALGVVASFARPGGNITGQSFFDPELSAKRIELVKELMPSISRVAYLMNPGNPRSAVFQAMEFAARSSRVELQTFKVRAPGEFEGAFEAMVQARIPAVVI